MLDLHVNGEVMTLPESLTVAELLDRLGYDRRRIAVEVNRAVVPRPQHDSRRLTPGDAIEIVTLVGGGSGEKDVGGKMNIENEGKRGWDSDFNLRIAPSA